MMFFCVLYSKEKYRCRVKIHAEKVLSINYFYQSNISHSDNIDFDENILYTRLHYLCCRWSAKSKWSVIWSVTSVTVMCRQRASDVSVRRCTEENAASTTCAPSTARTMAGVLQICSSKVLILPTLLSRCVHCWFVFRYLFNRSFTVEGQRISWFQ